MPDAIAKAAEEVLHLLGMWRLPVDPLAIAKEERIILSPGPFQDGFDARVEYYPDYRRFAIYYRNVGRPAGRINFSLGHELGHYYLPDHRQRLVAGEMHNSTSDYQSRKTTEREADEFSANLLMPEVLFRKAVSDFRHGVCTLGDLVTLAARLNTSVMSTAIRYCNVNIEPATLVVSQDGIVQWSYAAEDMKAHGCWFVPYGSRIPDKCQTAKLLADAETDGPLGHTVDPQVWFEWPRVRFLYEETMKMGAWTLTWLTVEE